MRKHVLELIDEIVKKMGSDYSLKSFENVAEQLTERLKKQVNAKYLWYTLYKGTSRSKIREANLNLFAKFLEYPNFRAFVDRKNDTLDPILNSVQGEYYCYVRMNREQTQILRSPVRISVTNGDVSYLLKGERLEYKGTVLKTEGCLFVLMRSTDGNKSFYHVYRIGNMTRPGVLQGIFSGVSTNFTPIGGRAVLIRTDQPFESLRTGKLDIKTLHDSELLVERRMAEYFENKSENNITIKTPSSFDTNDLGECS
jgi:hypothetical protein